MTVKDWEIKPQMKFFIDKYKRVYEGIQSQMYTESDKFLPCCEMLGLQ